MTGDDSHTAVGLSDRIVAAGKDGQIKYTVVATAIPSSSPSSCTILVE